MKLSFIFQQHIIISVKHVDWAFYKGNSSCKYHCLISVSYNAHFILHWVVAWPRTLTEHWRSTLPYIKMLATLIEIFLTCVFKSFTRELKWNSRLPLAFVYFCASLKQRIRSLSHNLSTHKHLYQYTLILNYYAIIQITLFIDN